MRINNAERQNTKGNEMASLELNLLVGAESKEWLAGLTKQIDRLEKLHSKDDTVKAEVEAEVKPRAKRAKKATASFDDIEDEVKPAKNSFDDAGDEDPIDMSELKQPKKTKAAKATVDDVNDACMTRAQETSRSEVLGILRRQFKVTSVTDLKTEQYADVIEAMALKE